MKKTLYFKNFILCLTVILLSACSTGTSTQAVSQAVPTALTEPEAAIEEPTQAPTAAATNTTEPTPIPATPAPELQPLNLVQQGFSQDGRAVGYAFIVENPNLGFAANSSAYMIEVSDASGNIIKSDENQIGVVFPGQKWGFGGNIYLDEGVEAAGLKIELVPGSAEFVTIDLAGFDMVDTFFYEPDEPGYASDKAFGAITNPFDWAVEYVNISVVVYDEAGEINGGGSSSISYIPANGTAGVEVSLNRHSPAAKVEFYPSFSYISAGVDDLKARNMIPEGAQNLTVVTQGYGQDGSGVGVGALIQNPNPDLSVTNARIYLTLYNEEGYVVDITQMSIGSLSPNQSIGFGYSSDLGAGVNITRAEFILVPGEFAPGEETLQYSFENTVIQSLGTQLAVTSTVTNPYPDAQDNVYLTAVAYNEAGEIIGGGSGYVNLPANGTAEARVVIIASGTPAKAELFVFYLQD